MRGCDVRGILAPFLVPLLTEMRCGGSISATVHPKGFGMGTFRGSLTTAYILDLGGANFRA